MRRGLARLLRDGAGGAEAVQGDVLAGGATLCVCLCMGLYVFFLGGGVNNSVV